MILQFSLELNSNKSEYGRQLIKQRMRFFAGLIRQIVTYWPNPENGDLLIRHIVAYLLEFIREIVSYLPV